MKFFYRTSFYQKGEQIIKRKNRTEYLKDGKNHRLDGPAVIRKGGMMEWWVNGKRHREDGPAKIYANGKEQWWKNGKNITEKVVEWSEQLSIPSWKELTDYEKTIFKLSL